MDKLKQWVALTAVGVLAVLAAGWFLVVSPKRSEAADLRTQATSQQQVNAGLQTTLARLKAQAKDLPRQQAMLAAVAAKLPDNPAMPSLIRALSNAADDAGVELVSLSPSAPALVAAAAGPATAPKPASTSGTTPVAPSAAQAATATSGTLQQIPIAINVVGGYFQVEQFFDRIENISRALKVMGLTLGPGSSPRKKTDAAAAAVAADPGRVLNSSINAMVYMSTGRTTAPAAPVAAK